jgi:hypothetical protein
MYRRIFAVGSLLGALVYSSGAVDDRRVFVSRAAAEDRATRLDSNQETPSRGNTFARPTLLEASEFSNWLQVIQTTPAMQSHYGTLLVSLQEAADFKG